MYRFFGETSPLVVIRIDRANVYLSYFQFSAGAKQIINKYKFHQQIKHQNYKIIILGLCFLSLPVPNNLSSAFTNTIHDLHIWGVGRFKFKICFKWFPGDYTFGDSDLSKEAAAYAYVLVRPTQFKEIRVITIYEKSRDTIRFCRQLRDVAVKLKRFILYSGHDRLGGTHSGGPIFLPLQNVRFEF